MDPSPIQGLHGTLSSAGVVVFDKAVVIALGLPFRHVSIPIPACRTRVGATCILVGDNLDVLDMASRLEDLAKDILSDALVQAADV